MQHGEAKNEKGGPRPLCDSWSVSDSDSENENISETKSVPHPVKRWKSDLSAEAAELREVVLVVGRERETCFVAAEFLKQQGYDVMKVEGGFEGLKIIDTDPTVARIRRTHSQNSEPSVSVTTGPIVSLVFCSVATKDMSGMEFLKRVMQDKGSRNIPVTMMSISPSEDIVSRCIRFGAQDCLTCPIRTHTVLALARGAISGANARKQLYRLEIVNKELKDEIKEKDGKISESESKLAAVEMLAVNERVKAAQMEVELEKARVASKNISDAKVKRLENNLSDLIEEKLIVEAEHAKNAEIEDIQAQYVNAARERFNRSRNELESLRRKVGKLEDESRHMCGQLELKRVEAEEYRKKANDLSHTVFSLAQGQRRGSVSRSSTPSDKMSKEVDAVVERLASNFETPLELMAKTAAKLSFMIAEDGSDTKQADGEIKTLHASILASLQAIQSDTVYQPVFSKLFEASSLDATTKNWLAGEFSHDIRRHRRPSRAQLPSLRSMTSLDSASGSNETSPATMGTPPNRYTTSTKALSVLVTPTASETTSTGRSPVALSQLIRDGQRDRDTASVSPIELASPNESPLVPRVAVYGTTDLDTTVESDADDQQRVNKLSQAHSTPFLHGATVLPQASTPPDLQSSPRKTTPVGLQELDESSGSSRTGDSSMNLSFEVSAIENYCSAVLNWDFNVFDYDYDQLEQVAYAVFDYFDMMTTFHIEPEVLRRFIHQVRKLYHDNPYHNWRHCIDTLQTLFLMIVKTRVRDLLDDIDVFAGIVAALIHDLDHPGHNNNFELNSMTDLCVTYNDISILESHHAASFFRLLLDERKNCNIFKFVDPESFSILRKSIIDMVLSTDMKSHFELLSKLNSIISNPANSQMDDQKQKGLILNIILHSADISNPCKTIHIAKKWQVKVREEFLAQGDLEKQLNLPVSAQCDRNTSDLSQLATSFIDFIVLPLFKSMAEIFPGLSVWLNNLKVNSLWWKKYKEVGEELPVEPSAAIPENVEDVDATVREVTRSNTAAMISEERSHETGDRRVTEPILSVHQPVLSIVNIGDPEQKQWSQDYPQTTRDTPKSVRISATPVTITFPKDPDLSPKKSIIPSLRSIRSMSESSDPADERAILDSGAMTERGKGKFGGRLLWLDNTVASPKNRASTKASKKEKSSSVPKAMTRAKSMAVKDTFKETGSPGARRILRTEKSMGILKAKGSPSARNPLLSKTKGTTHFQSHPLFFSDRKTSDDELAIGGRDIVRRSRAVSEEFMDLDAVPSSTGRSVSPFSAGMRHWTPHHDRRKKS